MSLLEWHSADKKRKVCILLIFTSAETAILVFMMLQTTTDVIKVLEQIFRQEFIIAYEGYTRCILLMLRLLLKTFLG